MTTEQNGDLSISESQLLTWLAGLLAGCDVCRAESSKWATDVGLQHEVPAEDATS